MVFELSSNEAETPANTAFWASCVFDFYPFSGLFASWFLCLCRFVWFWAGSADTEPWVVHCLFLFSLYMQLHKEADESMCFHKRRPSEMLWRETYVIEQLPDSHLIRLMGMSATSYPWSASSNSFTYIHLPASDIRSLFWRLHCKSSYKKTGALLYQRCTGTYESLFHMTFLCLICI